MSVFCSTQPHTIEATIHYTGLMHRMVLTPQLLLVVTLPTPLGLPDGVNLAD